MKRICPVCNMEFDGRADKKFCCDQCRNSYNNNIYADYANTTRNINRILKNNRRILFEFFDKGNFKPHKDKLMMAGYNFDYLTNMYKTKTGKTYFYCYDFGISFHDDGFCSIVEKKEYVD